MGVSMIEIGTLIKEVGWGYGIVTEIHTTKRGTKAYRIRWIEGGMGVLSGWQFEVIA
jgi:hypothetical protein